MGGSRDATEGLAKRGVTTRLCEMIKPGEHYYVRVESKWEQTRHGDKVTVTMHADIVHQETENLAKVNIVTQALNRPKPKPIKGFLKRFKLFLD